MGGESMANAADKPKAGRDRFWKELDDPGKIERLRQIVKSQASFIARMANFLTQLIEHEHVEGRMVKRIGSPDSECYGGFHCPKQREGWL